ncbi:MAG: NrfD/PsrC family molybdoenzyme membrane anchor subunit [Candidatus Rokuibacteriota bacterium]
MEGLLQSSHWPFIIDVYFFLGGLAGGAFVIATAALLVNAVRFRDVARIGYYLAFVALLPCPLILIVDLGVPARFLNMMMRFNVLSPMSMGAWALAGFGACAFLAALFTLLEDMRRSGDLTGAKRIVGVVGGFFGFFLAAYPGVLLGATAQPLWSNAHALGALFLAVGASTGAAAMALLLSFGGRRSADGVAALRLITALALVVQLLSVVVFVVSVQASGSMQASAALALLMSGPLSLLFWSAIVVGAVVPLVMGFMSMKRESFGLTAVASVLVLAGGFVVKYVIMAAGQI